MDFLFSDAEGLSTATSDDQCECEAMCSRFLVDFRSQRPKTKQDIYAVILLFLGAPKAGTHSKLPRGNHSGPNACCCKQ